MKLIQFYVPGKGPRVGLVRGDQVADITHAEDGVRSVLDLLVQGKTAAGLARRVEWLARSLHRRSGDWRELQRPPSRRSPHVLSPVAAPEVWVARPGPPATIFLKATAVRVAGPHGVLTLRDAERGALARPGIALVLSGSGEPLAATGYVGVTAPGFPPGDSRAETYAGCCAIGPSLVTLDELGDTRSLQMRLSVVRQAHPQISEPFLAPSLAVVGEAVSSLLDHNPCPVATVLANEAAGGSSGWPFLQSEDQLEVETQGIGRLVVRVAPERQSGTRGARADEPSDRG